MNIGQLNPGRGEKFRLLSQAELFAEPGVYTMLVWFEQSGRRWATIVGADGEDYVARDDALVEALP